MEIKLKDYEKVIKTLVWKFRNLGFADMMYAPVTDTSTDGISKTKMGNVEDGWKTKKPFRQSVINFEDLLSEAYVVFTELKNKFEAGEYPAEINFEQALVTKLESTFMNLYNALMREKRTGSTIPVECITETLPGPEVISFLQKALLEKGPEDGITPDLKQMAKDILAGNFVEINKESITKYLSEKGWKRNEIRRIFNP